MKTPKLQIKNLRKDYAKFAAVDGIDLEVSTGETVALLGSSGCGKSTTLNMIVGLETATSGDILIDGKSIVAIPPGQRNVGLVFQDYAVFTSMTVRENFAFGLRVRKLPKAKIASVVDEVAELLGMRQKLDAKASELGGSELQRVAIGRTLVTKPDILLLDEPLSNLEAAARLAMRKELRRLQKDAGLTIVYVTHDQIEALSLADRIAVMSAGKIRQVERASLICEQPQHLFVAAFMGSPPMNLLKGSVKPGNKGLMFAADRFAFQLNSSLDDHNASASDQVVLGIRPDTIRLTPATSNSASAIIRFVEPRGAEAVLTLDIAGQMLKAIVPAHGRPAEGSEVNVQIDEQQVVLFDGRTDHRLPLHAGAIQ